VIILR